jgi:hypothetical protein
MQRPPLIVILAQCKTSLFIINEDLEVNGGKTPRIHNLDTIRMLAVSFTLISF